MNYSKGDIVLLKWKGLQSIRIVSHETDSNLIELRGLEGHYFNQSGIHISKDWSIERISLEEAVEIIWEFDTLDKTRTTKERISNDLADRSIKAKVNKLLKGD